MPASRTVPPLVDLAAYGAASAQVVAPHETWYYDADGRVVAEESHREDRVTRYDDDGNSVVTFGIAHDMAPGEIWHYEDAADGADLARVEFAPWHARYGEIRYYPEDADGSVRRRTEYAPGHRLQGEIHRCGGAMVTFAADHPAHGEMRFYDPASVLKVIVGVPGYPNRRLARTAFELWHPRHGEVDHYDGAGRLVRTERAPRAPTSPPSKRARDRCSTGEPLARWALSDATAPSSKRARACA
jgi:hypothetical protein